MMNIFETNELYLACYLKFNGVELQEIKPPEFNSDKCKFVFCKNPKITELLGKWYSPETDNIRELLEVNKDMRYQLRQVINANQVLPEGRRQRYAR